MGYRFRGSHLFICDRCRLRYTSDKKRKEWTGLIVCEDCWEPRHPQDFVRARKEDTSVPDPRPNPPDVFVEGVENIIFALTDENGTPILDDEGEAIQVPIGVIS